MLGYSSVAFLLMKNERNELSIYSKNEEVRKVARKLHKLGDKVVNKNDPMAKVMR